MFDQLKGIWKCLLWGILLLPLLGEVKKEPKIDCVRVIEKDKMQILQTRILRFQKDEVKLDLVGVVHIGETQYYEALNEKLSAYDAVLYEMIGKGKPPKPGKSKPAAVNGKGEMAAVSRMYNIYTNLLELDLQKDVIDYHQDHFIHADMTLREFTEMQKKQDETVMKFAMQNMDLELLEDVDQAAMLGAMISGDSTLLKKSFIKILGQADESVAKKKDTSVIIRARNEKCLKVLGKELSRELSPSRVAIFYGAAHLPDFDAQLVEAGWLRQGGEWLNAWEVKE